MGLLFFLAKLQNVGEKLLNLRLQLKNKANLLDLRFEFAVF